MTILFFIFICSALVQILYWIFFGKVLRKLNIGDENENVFPVSIIVCFKNEATNIKDNIDSWIENLDNKDELILVDDFSEDQSALIIEPYLKGSKNIWLVNVSKDIPGKKQALRTGINAATNGWILLTDADCKVSHDWKKSMLSELQDHHELILGYAPFRVKKGLLNTFQRFECLLTAIQYFSYAKAGFPYMGVGRNLGLKKSSFEKNTINGQNLASGDDDLMVNALANDKNVHLVIDPNSFSYSDAKTNWNDYFNQKKRHVSSSVHYKWIHKILLSVFSGTQLIFNLLFVVLLFSAFWKVVAFIYFIRILLIAIEVDSANKMFKEPGITMMIPVLDLMFTFYYLILGFTLPFINRQKWN